MSFLHLLNSTATIGGVLGQGGGGGVMRVVLTFVIGAVLVLVMTLLALVLGSVPGWMWARRRGMPVTFAQVVGMRFRRVPPGKVLRAWARARDAAPGVADVAASDWETHHLAGGDIEAVAEALVASEAAGLALTWAQLCAIDLAGYDVAEAVRRAAEHGLSEPERGDLSFLDRLDVPRTGDGPM